MNPRLILAVILGGMTGVFTLQYAPERRLVSPAITTDSGGAGGDQRRLLR